MPLAFEKIAAVRDRSGFDCATQELNLYFRNQAGQDARRNLSSVYVLLEDDVNVVGFYTLSQSALTVELFPLNVSRKLPPKRDVACTLLGRLAVDTKYQGKGFGQVLLFHALQKAAQTSLEVASFAVIVDAKDDAAVKFYEKYGFTSFQDSQRKLFIPIKNIKILLDAREIKRPEGL